MKKYVLVIDEGTTGTRALIFDKKFNIIGSAYEEITQYTPKQDRVEHDAMEIYEKSVKVCKEALLGASVDPNDIDSIAITNQRNTTVLWDKTTGEPITKAIVWQDTRTADLCTDIKNGPKGEKILQTTGKVMAPFCVGVLLKWMLENVEGAKQKAEAGQLLAGTIDSWLVWKLTGRQVHAISYSNASSSGIMNLEAQSWYGELLDDLGIPASLLPEIREESADYGKTDFLGPNIPITGVAADQQSALFAQGCYEKGTVKCTNGTGTFMDINIGTKCVVVGGGLDTLIAWKLNGETVYCVEGFESVTGSIIQWLRDGLEIIATSKDSEDIANSVEDTNGVFFVPALAGLISPQQDPYARGLIIGLTRGVKRAHIVRAALEAIALRTKDIIDAVEKSTGIKISEMKIDGGASQNNLLAQMMADYMSAKIVRPLITEASSIGAAQFAGIYTGFYKKEDFEVITAASERVFEPRMPEEERNKKYSTWKEAVNRSMGWAKF